MLNAMYNNMRRDMALAELYIKSEEGGELENLIEAKVLLAKAERDVQWFLRLGYERNLMNDSLCEIYRMRDEANRRKNEVLAYNRLYEEPVDIEILMDIIDFGE